MWLVPLRPAQNLGQRSAFGLHADVFYTQKTCGLRGVRPLRLKIHQLTSLPLSELEMKPPKLRS
jgi:hypothetical protein